MSVSINGTNGLTFNDGSTQTTSPFTGGFGFRNRIINGDMRIDQRNNGGSITFNDGVFPIDRWTTVATQSSKGSIQQNAGSVTPPPGFTNYLGFTSSSAYSVLTGDAFAIQQRLEGLNLSDFGWGTASATNVILLFWVRSSLTGTFGGSISNSAQNRSYPFTYTINAANTWELEAITIPGDTSGTWLTTNGIGARLNLGLGAGATFSATAGAWNSSTTFSATGATSVVGTNGATFYVTGVDLQKGSTATSFDYRPYGTEELLCKRYYERITTVGGNGGFISFAVGQCISSSAANFPVFFQTKRTTPTMNNSTVSNFGVLNSTDSSFAVGAITWTQIGFSVAQAAATSVSSSPLTAGHATRLLATGNNSAWIEASAEL